MTRKALGGLNTSVSSLKSNLFISSAIACTGVITPITLSFLLVYMANATSLQAFAAGASLCSTSLGTTFTVMSVSNLTNTRLGTVLGTAAMEDDVIGLVIIQIIISLSSSDATNGPVMIIRPIAVSVAFAIVLPLTSVLILKPVIRSLIRQPAIGVRSLLLKTMKNPRVVLVIHTTLLLGLMVGASYAGTSTLYAAYLAGVCISWFDEAYSTMALENQSEQQETSVLNTVTPASYPSPLVNDIVEAKGEGRLTGIAIYEQYYAQPLNKVLRPFFFASVGFSIPITQMFSGAVIWRGVLYAMLMALGKLVCGIWFIGHSARTATEAGHAEPETIRSLYPAAILGSAMVARGEIGFLVSSLAASNGIFVPSENLADVFLIVTWAIVLCTILGPVAVGLLVKKLKALQRKRDRSTAGTESTSEIYSD